MSETTEREVRVPSELVEIDIIGKEFEGIEFEGDNKLTYCKIEHGQLVGVTGIVQNNHPSYPQYTCVEFPNGRLEHYYTKDVIFQVSYKLSDNYIKKLYEKIFETLKDNGRYFNQRKSS